MRSRGVFCCFSFHMGEIKEWFIKDKQLVKQERRECKTTLKCRHWSQVGIGMFPQQQKTGRHSMFPPFCHSRGSVPFLSEASLSTCHGCHPFSYSLKGIPLVTHDHINMSQYHPSVETLPCIPPPSTSLPLRSRPFWWGCGPHRATKIRFQNAINDLLLGQWSLRALFFSSMLPK